MGIFISLIDKMKPVITSAIKKSAKRRGTSTDTTDYNRNVDIPSELMAMKEVTVDSETRALAKKFSALLEMSELAGPDNMFGQIAAGRGLKGRVIRSFVFSQSLKKNETDARRLFLQMLMDTTIEGAPDVYVNNIIKAFGDDPNVVRDKAKEAGFELLLDITDEDLENISNKLF